MYAASEFPSSLPCQTRTGRLEISHRVRVSYAGTIRKTNAASIARSSYVDHSPRRVATAIPMPASGCYFCAVRWSRRCTPNSPSRTVSTCASRL